MFVSTAHRVLFAAAAVVLTALTLVAPAFAAQAPATVITVQATN